MVRNEYGCLLPVLSHPQVKKETVLMEFAKRHMDTESQNEAELPYLVPGARLC